MTEEFLISPLGQLLFAMVWTSIAALFAWIGLRIVVPGYKKRQFRYMFVTFREADRPLTFKIYLGFMTIWTGMACLFVSIGLVFVSNAFVGLFQ